MPKRAEDRPSRDFLLRGLPLEVAEKLKVAASLHRVSMRDYIQGILEGHLQELEQQGFKLKLPEGQLSQEGIWYSTLHKAGEKTKQRKGQKKD